MKASLLLLALTSAVALTLDIPTNDTVYVNIERRQMPQPLQLVQAWIQQQFFIDDVDDIGAGYEKWASTDFTLWLNKLGQIQTPTARSRVQVSCFNGIGQADVDIENRALLQFKPYRYDPLEPNTMNQYYRALRAAVLRFRADNINTFYTGRQRFVVGLATGESIFQALDRGYHLEPADLLTTLQHDCYEVVNMPLSMRNMGILPAQDFTHTRVDKPGSPQNRGFVLTWMQVP